MGQTYWSSLPIVSNFHYKSLERNFAIVPMSSFKKYITRPMVYKLLPESFLGRWDLISSQLYNTSIHWWALLEVNDILDPFDPLLQGKTIACPDIFDIITFLNANSFVRNIR